MEAETSMDPLPPAAVLSADGSRIEKGDLRDFPEGWTATQVGRSCRSPEWY